VRGLGETVERQMVENHHLLRNGTGYFTRIFGCINLDSSYEMLLISKKKNIRCDPGLWRISPTKDRERFPANGTSKYL
jgi:hypothetical protein